MNFLKTICFSVLFLSLNAAFGQASFDRLYIADTTDFVSTQILDNDGEGYYVFSVIDTANFVTDSIPNSFDPSFLGNGLSLLTLDDKGETQNSFEYFTDDTLGYKFSTKGIDIQKLSNGDLVFTATTLSVGNELNKLIGLIQSNGAMQWVFSPGDSTLLNKELDHSQIVVLPDDSFIASSYYSFADQDSMGICLSRITNRGETLWTRVYTTEGDITSFSADLSLMPDTTLVVGGSYGTQQYYAMKMDVNGNVDWSNKYFRAEGQLIDFRGIVSLNDTTAVIAGQMRQGLSEDLSLLKIDGEGNIDTAVVRNQLSFAQNPMTISTSVSGDIYVGGSFTDNTQEDGFYIEKVSSDLMSQFVYSFQDTASHTNYIGQADIDYVENANPGAVLAFPSISEGSPNDIHPRIIKLDDMGLVRLELSEAEELEYIDCHDTILRQQFQPVDFTRDTLIFSSFETFSRDTIDFTTRPYNFNVPRLSINGDTIVCMKDSTNFMFELDATIDGAVSYEWTSAETGDAILGTDSTFIATKANVEYLVTVKIQDQYCYTQCATKTIPTIQPPSVTIVPNVIEDCERLEVDLRAVISIDPNTELDRFEWNTGITNQDNITVTEPGTYSITVLDNCGESASFSIDVQRRMPDPIIVAINRDSICDGVVRLFVVDENNFTNLFWNNGETTSFIDITSPGNYEVEGTDECDMTIRGTRQVNATDFDTNLTAICPEGTTTNNSDCEFGCLCFPNVFLPSETGSDNQYFGPDNRCDDNGRVITDYEMSIYNRYGNRIYVTTQYERIENGWNGFINGSNNRAPAEVYYYLATYKIDGTDFSHKGSLTLLR